MIFGDDFFLRQVTIPESHEVLVVHLRQEQTLFKYHNNDDEDNPDYLPKKDAECLKNKK